MSSREIQTKYTNFVHVHMPCPPIILDLVRRPRLPADVVQKCSPCLPAALIRLQHHSLCRASRLCLGVLSALHKVYIHMMGTKPIYFEPSTLHNSTQPYQLHSLHTLAPWQHLRRLHQPPHPPNTITSKASKKPSKRKAAKRPSPAPAVSPSS